MNILGLTRQHKIAWKSGRKFILKFSPQADFNFVQPWPLLSQPTRRLKGGLLVRADAEKKNQVCRDD